jgi:hypothetical protein
MKILATLIAKELKNAKHYAVYEPELARVWPEGENRQAQIASFAKKQRLATSPLQPRILRNL